MERKLRLPLKLQHIFSHYEARKLVKKEHKVSEETRNKWLDEYYMAEAKGDMHDGCLHN